MWITVFLRCLCPALRIHNHTVLPSSHNSSYVYTNDSAYTNISATVGEDQSLSALWNSFVHHRLLSVVLSVSTHGWALPHFPPRSVFCPCSTRWGVLGLLIVHYCPLALVKPEVWHVNTFKPLCSFMSYHERCKTLMFITLKNDLWFVDNQGTLDDLICWMNRELNIWNILALK